MIKKNKKLIRIILFSLVITGTLQGNANAINISKNIKMKSVSINVQETEDERREKLVQEYQSNKFLKDFIDTVSYYDKNLLTKSHDEQIAGVLDISQKLQLAKDSGLSKQALDFIDEIIKELEPIYSNLLNEAKNKEIKPVPIPPKESKDDVKPTPKESKDDVKPTPKEKQEEKNKQESMQQKLKEYLPKTGTNFNNTLLVKISSIASLIGIYIMKTKK